MIQALLQFIAILVLLLPLVYLGRIALYLGQISESLARVADQKRDE